MNKDVLLSIKGLQLDGVHEDGNVETITPATYYKKNDSHYVLYDEVAEGTDEITKNVIKIKEDSLEVTKKGFVNVHMLFEENKKNLVNYATPFGNIMVGIDARSVNMSNLDNQIQVNVDYSLEVNYEFLTNCKISIIIENQNTKQSSIFGE